MYIYRPIDREGGRKRKTILVDNVVVIAFRTISTNIIIPEMKTQIAGRCVFSYLLVVTDKDLLSYIYIAAKCFTITYCLIFSSQSWDSRRMFPDEYIYLNNSAPHSDEKSFLDLCETRGRALVGHLDSNSASPYPSCGLCSVISIFTDARESSGIRSL